MSKGKINLNKIESIQISNFLLKKDIKSKLIEETYLNNQQDKLKQQYNNFINIFIEDLFNIINQQILTCSQIYESTEETKMENLIINNKTISFNMIINFFDKIFSLLKERLKLKNFHKMLSSNNVSGIRKIKNYIDNNNGRFSCNNKTYLRDSKISSNLEEKYFKKKFNKTNSNKIQNNIQSKSKNIKNNSINCFTISSNNISCSSKNIFSHKNNCAPEKKKNLKSYYINLNNLKENDGKDIEIYIKPNKSKKFESGTGSFSTNDPSQIEKKDNKQVNENNNYNNHIIFIKQIYRGCSSNYIKKYKDYLNNDKKKRNSFNKKIIINKKSIEESKMQLKNIREKSKEKELNLNEIIIKNKTKNYRPFKPRNHKHSHTCKLDIKNEINNNENFQNLTQRIEKTNYYNDNNNNENDINKLENTLSEKILYDFNKTEVIKSNDNILIKSYDTKFNDNNFEKIEMVESKDHEYNEINPFTIEPNNTISLSNNNVKTNLIEKEKLEENLFNNKNYIKKDSSS